MLTLARSVLLAVVKFVWIMLLSLVGVGLCLLALIGILLAFNRTMEMAVGRLALAPAGVWEISGFQGIDDLALTGDSLIFSGHRTDGRVDCRCMYAASLTDGQILWSTESIAAPQLERYRNEHPESSLLSYFLPNFISESTQTIYTGIYETLYALNSVDGTVRWQTEADTYIVEAETVLVVDPRENLLRLDPQNGSPLWQQPLPPGSTFTMLYLEGARVYAQRSLSGSAQILAIDALDGSILWEHKARAVSWGALAMTEELLFYAHLDDRGTEPYLTALDNQTGAVVWEVQFPEKLFDRPQLKLVEGQLYLLSELVKDDHGQSILRAVDPVTGKVLWSFNEDQTLGSILYQVQNGRVYIGTAQKGLLALNSESGGVLWQTALPAAATYLEAIEEILLVGMDESEIYALDIQTGQIKWQNAADLYLSKGHALLGDLKEFLTVRQNILYTAGRSPLVQAIDIKTGSDLWTWNHNNWYAYLPGAKYRLGLVLQDRLFILGSDGRFSATGFDRILQIKVEP